jgi:Mg2+ and Co2+ transporter CorA
VLRFPVMLARPRRLSAAELRLAVGRDWVLAAHDGDLRPLVALFDDLQLDAERRADVMASPDTLAHTIVRSLLTASSGWSERLGSALQSVEDAVFAAVDDAPRQLMQLRGEVAELDRMVQPLPGLLEQLAAREVARWRDAADVARRQARQLDEAAARVDGLDRALDHELSRRRNVLLRTIAVVSAATLPGILVGTLPRFTGEWAFEIQLAAALLAGLATVAALRRTRWL